MVVSRMCVRGRKEEKEGSEWEVSGMEIKGGERKKRLHV